MNILFLNSSRQWGGNEKWTCLAAKSLAENHGVFLACRGEAVASRFCGESRPMPFLFEFDPVTIHMLKRMIRKRRIDVLIPTKKKDYVLAGLAAKQTGIANVLRLGIVRTLSELHHRWIYGHLADGIIVNAKAIRDELLNSGFIKPEHIRVIYNGLDEDHIDSLAHASGLSFSEGLHLITISRLTALKHVDHVIRAFHQFVSKSPDAHATLHIVGDGPEEPSLRELGKQLGINRRLMFHGYTENPYRLIAASRIFISMSENEGLSNALLEAMLLRNTVITTPAGDAGFIIDDRKNGFVIPHGHIRQLAELLDELYRHPSLVQKTGVQAREDVIGRFSMEAMGSQIEQFLEECVNRR